MVLIPTGRDFDDRLVPCVITQARAWVWSRDVGDPVEATFQACEFAKSLRLPDNLPTFIKIVSFVEDMLDDLLDIPPFPQSEKSVVAEAIIYDKNGTAIRSTELRD